VADGAPREQCSQCGFDSDLYDRADTISSQRIIAPVLSSAIEAVPQDTLRRRPNGHSWSIAEHIDHVGAAAFGNQFVVESALADPGIDLGEPPTTNITTKPATVDTAAALQAVGAEYEALGALLGALDEADWATPVTVTGETKSIEWFARHGLHTGLHHLADIGRIRHGFGLGAATQHGTVTQINTSGGGVPKLPVESATISAAGVSGDRQNDRRHHGRPIQAVCLWSSDVITTLQEEGHPVAPGNAGENLTIAGVDWAAIRPGTQLRVGSVPMLVSAYAIPCAKNAQWFHDRNFNRMLHDRNPGFSRIYAIPLGSGTVNTGDTMSVEPN